MRFVCFLAMRPGKVSGLLARCAAAAVSSLRTRRDKKSVGRFWVCLWCAWLCAPALALDPNQSLQQLHHTAWTARDGLLGMVLCLAQTTDGYLWAGTTDGLFRFDGFSFEAYQPENAPFPSKSVETLLADPDGGLWIGYDRGGASFLKNGRVINYTGRDGLPGGRVRNFALDMDGNIWAGTVGGLGRLEGGRWTVKYKEWNYSGISPGILFVDDRGTLWVCTGQTIMFMPRGAKRFQDTGIRVKTVFAFAQSPDGAVWYIDLDHTFAVALTAPSGPLIGAWSRRASVSASAAFDRDGVFWMTQEDNGVWRIPSAAQLPGLDLGTDSAKIDSFGSKRGLSSDTAQCVLEDREGNIWISTLNGLDRFRNRNLSWSQVLPGKNRFNLVAGNHGDIWAGLQKGGGSIVHIPDGKHVPGGPELVFGAYHDTDGTLWFYPWQTLVHWQGDKFNPIELPKGALSDRVRSLTRDGAGNLWASVEGSGEYYLKDGIWTFVTVLKSDPHLTAGRAFTDAQGRVWLVYLSKAATVAAIDHGAIRIYSVEQGLSGGSANTVAGNQQQIWAGGEGGLFFLQGDQFRKLQAGDGSDFGVVTEIVVTASDGLWLTGTYGIVHIPDAEILRALSQADYKVNYELFNLVSDLPEPVRNEGPPLRVLAQGSDGLLWFTTESGVARIDPAHIFRNALPPPVSIRSVVADGKAYSAYTEATLPALTKNVQISYAGLSLSIPERVKFRYRVEGADTDWTDAGSRRTAYLQNLPPGHYYFHVIACNNDGVWNESGAVWGFVVAPAFYQTVWFGVVCVLAAAGLMWWLYLRRLAYITGQIQQRLGARMEERERIARELHDTLLQGFQGLLLRFQAVLKTLPQDWPAHQMLERALDRADEVLLEGRQSVRDLREEGTSETELPEALRDCGEEIGHDHTSLFSLTILGEPKPLVPVVFNESYRIAREAIMNAFQHSRAQKIEVELTYGESELSLRVRDDGVGIDATTLSKGRTGHWGLSGMRERAQKIAAQVDIWSQVGAGTEIELTIPSGIAYPRNKEQSLWRRIKAALTRDQEDGA